MPLRARRPPFTLRFVRSPPRTPQQRPLLLLTSSASLHDLPSLQAKPYKSDMEIVAMTDLVAAYQRNDIGEFERILRSNRATIMDDAFIRNYIEDVLKNIRTQVRVTTHIAYAPRRMFHCK